MLNTDHLYTFLIVAETGSYTAAATRLGFTQPAVSQHIKALEAQLGDLRLFRRVGKRMRLTQAGEALLVHAREVVHLAERAEQHMLSLRGQVTGRVGIGCAPTSGERVIPMLLAALHTRHPGVQFAVDVGLPEQLFDWLERGQVQAALVDDHPRRRAYEVLELGREPVACIAPRAHPLVGTTPDWEELARQTLILPQRGTALRRAIEEHFRRQGSTPTQLHVVLETDSVAVALEAAGDGLGIAFVPRSRLPKTREIGEIQLPVALEQAWFLVRQRGGSPNRAVDELWHLIVSDEGRKLLTRLGLHHGHR